MRNRKHKSNLLKNESLVFILFEFSDVKFYVPKNQNDGNFK